MALFKRSHSNIAKLKEVLAYIKQLKRNPFNGWSEAQEGAYLTACISIEKKITDILNSNE